MTLANANVKKGFQGKFYFDTGTYASPTWAEASKGVTDCTVNAVYDNVDTPVRAAGGLKAKEPVLLDISIAGKVRSNEADTDGFLAMETAFLAKTVIDLMVLDGSQSTNGARGYRLDAKVTKFSQSQNPGDVDFHDFELTPCIPQNGPPQYAIVATGTPGFTPIAG